MGSDGTEREPSRREFLRSLGTAAGATGILGAGTFLPLAASATARDRTVSLRSIHTREETEIVYWRDGRYVPNALATLDRQLRDHRTGDVHAIDPRLYDILVALQDAIGRHGQYEVISGYRSPRTNRLLSARSSGVAKKSLHMRGLAIDVRLPGTSLKTLRNAAIDLEAGGVGYYPSSNFIHIDLGRPRSW